MFKVIKKGATLAALLLVTNSSFSMTPDRDAGSNAEQDQQPSGFSTKALESRMATLANKALEDKISNAALGGDIDESTLTVSEGEENPLKILGKNIAKHWKVTSDMAGKECRINLRITPGSLVVKVREAKGDKDVCKSVRVAVRKVSPLTLPEGMELDESHHSINLMFNPK